MRNSRSILNFFCTFLLSVVLIGCGGGTTGTGDPGTAQYAIVGIVKSDADAPLAGAEVTVRESGESTTTDSEGRYAVETELQPGTQITLQISGDNFDNNVSVGKAPATPATIKVNLTVSVANNQIVVESIQLEEVTPTPQPQTTQSPNVSDPTPTAEVKSYSTDVKGIVVNETGIGLSGISIKIVHNGKSATTKRDGSFLIKTPSRTSSIQLLVTGAGGLNDTVTIKDLPKDKNLIITLKLVVKIPPTQGTTGSSIDPQPILNAELVVAEESVKIQ